MTQRFHRDDNGIVRETPPRRSGWSRLGEWAPLVVGVAMVGISAFALSMLVRDVFGVTQRHVIAAATATAAAPPVIVLSMPTAVPRVCRTPSPHNGETVGDDEPCFLPTPTLTPVPAFMLCRDGASSPCLMPAGMRLVPIASPVATNPPTSSEVQIR